MRHRIVFDEITEECVAILPHGGFEGDGMSRDIENLPHFFVRDIHRASDLFLRRLALENLLQAMAGLLDTIDGFADVDRQANGAALIGDRTSDRLANPPSG